MHHCLKQSWLVTLGVLVYMAQAMAACAGTQEVPPMTSREKAQIVSVTPSASEVPVYDLFELTVLLKASYENPFDPGQVNLSAEFTDPAGQKIVTPGFFYQPYTNRNETDDSKLPELDAAGPPCWKIRFAPTGIGTYGYVVRLQNSFEGQQVQLKTRPDHFAALPPKSHGFIRVAQPGNRYFRFDSGRPFFPVGQNLQNDWPVYRHSRLLAQSGANAARAWTFCHWTWLEWTFLENIPWAGPGNWLRDNAGAGRYNQRIAWIADQQFQRWTRDGLSVMLCLGNPDGSGELSRGDKETRDRWEAHPYNIANGGFLDDPAKFWTDPRAKKLYKQRLGYMVARWGYSRAIWAWELWNEAGEMTPEMVAWHREMAEYLRSIDPNRHLVTTSTWQWAPWKFAAVWDHGAMDFTQSHVYAPLPELEARIQDHLVRWARPHIVGEGGGQPLAMGQDRQVVQDPIDPEGIDFHNALWAPVMTGAAGTTLPWHWRDRIEPKNLFFHYRAIADFVRDVPWTSQPFRTVQVRSIVLDAPPSEKHFSPVLVLPQGSAWGRKAESNRFVVGPDGNVPKIDQFAKQLFGEGRQSWRNPPRLQLDAPVAGKFIVHVEETSSGILEVYLDGRRVLRDTSLQVPRREIRRNFAVDLPAGQHEIMLNDAGSDWLLLGPLVLTLYRDATRYPDLEILGLASQEQAILWVRNRTNEWSYRAAGIVPQPVGPATAILSGLSDGKYRLTWWDTYHGRATTGEEMQVKDSVLRLHLPAIDRDTACKLVRISP